MNGEDTCRAADANDADSSPRKASKSQDSGSPDSRQLLENALLLSLRELVLEQRQLNGLIAEVIRQNAETMDMLMQSDPGDDDLSSMGVYLDGKPRN